MEIILFQKIFLGITKKNVDIIQKVISKEARILDVGCAFGGLLNELKKEGYTHLLGLEPSEKNCHYAKEVYDITVLEGNWGNEMPISEEKFDLIIFSAVLEHLLDFKSDIQRCKKYLNNDGYLYIVLPDVELYSEQDDLYQEFSSEHINYFDIDFLNLMMVENGYVLVEFERDYIGAMGISGSFCSLWKSTNGSFDKENISSAILVENLHESTVEEKFELYLKQCHKVMVQMNKKIRDFKFDDGYYIWGAGTSAAMMAQLGIIKYPEIKGVIDSNLNYKGQEAFGCQIVQPKDLKNMKNRPILVTSQYAFHEINQYLIREGISNKVINLYT